MKKSVYFILISGLFVLFFLPGCKSSQSTAHRQDYKYEQKSNKQLSDYQKKIVREAESWMGTPYQYAAADKGEGADCSGLVMKVFLELFDFKLPRNSAKQAEFCNDLKAEEVEPGDLVFFATGKDPNKVSHVGIMIDGDSFIHSSTTKGVCISSVSSPYYIRTFIKYGRVPQISGLRADK